MYRKKLKSNLNPQTPTTTSKTFRPVIHSNSFNNPVQSTSTTTKQDFDFSLNDSTFSIRSRITNLNSTTLTTTTTPATTNEKRKSLFSDFDLSDIKLDDSFKSFSKLSSMMMMVEKSPNLERKSPPKRKFDESSINLDDIDFDDDLLSSSTSQLLDDKKPLKTDDSDQNNNTSNNNNNDSNENYFTDAETDAMIKLVKNNLLKSPDKNKNDTVKNNESSKSMDNFDHLLNDDDDFDLDDLDDIDDDDIDEIFVQIQNDQQTNKQQNSSSSSLSISSKNQNDENFEFEFKTANGRQCTKPSEIHYKRTRSLFLDIEELLLKEICGYRKFQQQQQQQQEKL